MPAVSGIYAGRWAKRHSHSLPGITVDTSNIGGRNTNTSFRQQPVIIPQQRTAEGTMDGLMSGVMYTSIHESTHVAATRNVVSVPVHIGSLYTEGPTFIHRPLTKICVMHTAGKMFNNTIKSGERLRFTHVPPNTYLHCCFLRAVNPNSNHTPDTFSRPH